MWLTQLRQAQTMETWEGQLLSVPARTPISHADVGDEFGWTRVRLPNRTMGTLSQNGSFPNLLGPQLSNKAV